MDCRTALQKNDHLPFPGMDCVIDEPAGRGRCILAYTGHYKDQEDPGILHRVLIRELFPYDPSGGISRLEDGDLRIREMSQALYDRYRTGFLRSNEVHSRMAAKIPADLDLHINTFSCHNTLYSLMGYTGGRTLEQEIRQAVPEISASAEDGLTKINPVQDSSAGGISEEETAPVTRQDSGTEERKNRFRLLRIVRILRSALQVLQTFHDSGCLHLDISPDNILLVGEGERERVTLIDYDSVLTIEEVRGDPSLHLSKKEGYTAPEISLGQRSCIGMHTDLFALTAVFWYCLSGSRLSPVQRTGAIPPDPFTLPVSRGLPGTVLSMLSQIIRKGLASSPGRRYQHGSELSADLTELEERILGRGITPWALWESGRARFYRLMRGNASLQYICRKDKLFPLRAETEAGERKDLFSLLEAYDTVAPDTFGPDPDSRDPFSQVPFRQDPFRSCMEKPTLLLGSGGLGKTTALYRLAWSAYANNRIYEEDAPAVFYISLYGYRDGNSHFIQDTLLEGLKFKPETDSMDSARKELMRLLDEPFGSFRVRDGAGRQFRGNDPAAKQIPEDAAAGRQFRADNIAAEHSREQERPAGKQPGGTSPVLILLLDGLNEVQGDSSPLMQEIHLLAEKRNLKILLTSRSDPADPLFEKITLCRLDSAHVRRILSGEGILPPENMEVFDLLCFPILLSLYIAAVKSGGEGLYGLQDRDQLLEAYFKALRKKEIAALSPTGFSEAGVDAVFLYLLPEIAFRIRQRGCALTDQELMDIAEKCYRELSGRSLTAVFPQWIGHRDELRLGCSDTDSWYGRAVLGILQKRAGILVRDEQGRIRILHQILEDYLDAAGRRFHLRFDREKRRRRITRGTIAAAAAVLLILLFAIYNFRMRREIEEKHLQMIRSETEQEILESVSRSGKELSEEKREAALNSAVEAVLLSYADSAQAERVIMEEDGLSLLWKDLPVILERIGSELPDTQAAGAKAAGQNTDRPAAVDSTYLSMAQKALTDALGVYDFRENRFGQNRPGSKAAPLFPYDTTYAHTEARISADKKTILLLSPAGFRICSAQSGEKLCDRTLPDPEKICRTDYHRMEDCPGGRLEVTWLDGSSRLYDAADGRLLKEYKTNTAEDLSAAGSLGGTDQSSADKGSPADTDGRKEETAAARSGLTDYAEPLQPGLTDYTEPLQPSLTDYAEPLRTGLTEFETDQYRLALSGDNSLLILDPETGEELGVFETDTEIRGVRQMGENLLIECRPSGSIPCSGLLVDENFEILAELPGLCDVLDNELVFDCSSCLRITPVYSLQDLMRMAVKANDNT